MPRDETAFAFIERDRTAKLRLRYSEGWRNLGKVVNRATSWSKFCERLAQPVLDNITTDQYQKLGPKSRHERKNHGWFVGGTFKDGIRRLPNIECRSMLCYDLDECSPELYEALLLDEAKNTGYLADYEHFVYTTRSHTPEKPRVRVVVPLSREITPTEFGPVCRIIASKIDELMEQIDPVSFRVTQLMFLPSQSSDGDFRSNWCRAKLLNPDVVLESWAKDFDKDYSRLPRSPREAGKLREHGVKVGDPRKKRGIVGAWCRAHSLTELLAEHWSNLYEPGDATVDGTLRYTYKPGSTTNGVLIYEDTWAYSHHSSDPISNTLVNAWDLERILRFGHLDKFSEEDEWEPDPRHMPSFKAMQEFAQDDREVQLELQASNYATEAIADDLPVEEDPPSEAAAAVAEFLPPPEPPGKWMERLEVNHDGVVKSTLHNVIVILENDQRFKGAIAYNTFSLRSVLVRPIASRRLGWTTGPLRDRRNGDPLKDVDVSLIRAIMEGPRTHDRPGWGLKISSSTMNEAVDYVASCNRFHPVQRFLETCRWDGVPRLRKLLHTYWHAEDNEYHALVGYIFMVAAVARIYEPGHKFDFVPIFEGKQDLFKSTSLEVLAGEGTGWFGEFHLGARRSPREIVEALIGKWIVELPELVELMDDKRSVESLKALFSSKSDRTRMAYLRRESDYDRGNIFTGTTNNKEYFRDPTGNRRYWPIILPDLPIDIEGLRRDRELLWAEARLEYEWHRRQPGQRDLTVPLPLFLTGAAKKIAGLLQGDKMLSSDRDIRKGKIEAWLDTPVPVSQIEPGWRHDGVEPAVDEPRELRQETCIEDLRYHLFDEKGGRAPSSWELGAILSHLPGWQKAGLKRCGQLGPQRVWKRVEPL